MTTSSINPGVPWRKTALPTLELLLQPVSEAKPTGDNLEYQPEFAELEHAVRGKPPRQMGAAVAPGEPPNYARVIDLASALLCRSKDLRVAAQLARALLETAGFAGFVEGLGLVRGLLERYWEEIHPQLDPDDRDATMRLAALSSLSAPELVSVVRAAPLLDTSRFGRISLRDVAIALGELPHPPSHPELDKDVIAGSFRAADPRTLAILLGHLQSAREHLNGIEVLASRPGMVAPDFRPLARALDQAGSFVRPYLDEPAAGTEHVEPSEPQAEAAETSTPGVAPHGAKLPRERATAANSIRGRDDVVHWLDRICDYYARQEPSSPLPLLLQRCRRLVASSFVEIVRDLAPDALSQIQNITGKTDH